MHPFVETLVGRVPGAMAVVLACGALFALLGLAAAVAILAVCRRKSHAAPASARAAGHRERGLDSSGVRISVRTEVQCAAPSE
jgi:hypothetical protein